MGDSKQSLIANEELRKIIELALAEDHISNDVTSKLIIPESLEAKATLLAKASGVLAGIEVFKAVFERVDSKLTVEVLLADGSRVKPGDVAATVSGRVRGILAAERTAMNFICHLSGVATATSRYVEQVKGLPVSIVDTRKTSAGQRLLEKHAVVSGGGKNHRMSLADGILVKDNHIAALKHSGMRLGDIVARARRESGGGLKLEVEVTSLAEAVEAAGAGADTLLLDNMSVADMKKTVALLRGRARFEASGGITLENVRAVAETGVDIISIGALTHSARALDFSLEMA